MINIIYGLKDPRNNVYQYIGKSSVGIERPLSHLLNSHSININKWIKELKSNSEYPIIDIIEEVEDLNNLNIREKFWIKYYYNLNPNLLNIQSIKDDNFETCNFKIHSLNDKKDFNNLVNILDNIPKILKNERLCRNLSQEQIANMANVNRATISLIENGKTGSIEYIKKYIKVLKETNLKTNIITKRIRK